MLDMMSIEQLNDKAHHLSEDYSELWKLMNHTKNFRVREQLFELQQAVGYEVTEVRKVIRERIGE
jgi:hypothetical protein